MEIKEILSEDRILFNLNSDSKEDIIKEIAKLFLNEDIIKTSEFDQLVIDLIEREKLSSTGMQDGIAIPHAKSETVRKLSMAVVIDKEGKDFSSMDELKSKVFFMIIGPSDCGQKHLDLLQKISKLTFEEQKLNDIINTNSKKEVIDILSTL